MEQAGSQSTVPKFGSFKPKVPSSKWKENEAKQPGRRCRDSRERHGESHPHRHRRSYRDAQRDADGLQDASAEPRKATEEHTNDDLEESDLFIIDRRGDKKNIEFGGLHRYSVPAYHRIGSGCVVGADGSVKIDRNESSDKAILLRDSLHSATTEKNARPLLSKQLGVVKNEERTIRFIPVGEDPENEIDLEFIPLRLGSRKRKRSTGSDEESDGLIYRSIERKAKPVPTFTDEDLQYASDPDLDQTQHDFEAQTRLRIAELTRKTKETPEKVDAWLELIDHQRMVVRPGVEEESFTAADRHTLADFRVSIYERAMKHIRPLHPGYDRLCAGLLDEGAAIWESSTLASKWDESIANNTGSVLLWKKYLNFLQTQSAVFSFSKCKDAYIRCLKQCNSESSISSRELPKNRVYIFLRMTAFLRDAGYDEFAHSLWQVLLEYHFFRPERLVFDRSAELKALEEWWEADVPRIGEINAAGWDSFFAGGSKMTRPTLSVDNTVQTWSSLASKLKHEIFLSTRHFLPATLDDEQAESDPFRFVMFSDMTEILPSMFVGLPKELIVDGWLVFIGFPPLPTMSIDLDCNNWLSDVFLQQHTLSSRPHNLTETLFLRPGEEINSWCQRYTAYDLFLHGRFTALPLNMAAFADRVIQSLLTRLDDNQHLAECYLAYLASISAASNNARKSAKRLLKLRPDSLQLYNALALVEVRAGQLDKAAEVWKAALSGIPSQQKSGDDAVISLWHSWMLTAIHHQSEGFALGVILGMANGPVHAEKIASMSINDIGAGQRIRTTNKWLSEEIDRSIAQRAYGDTVLLIECLAWLTYISCDNATDDVLAIYDNFFTKLEVSPKPPPMVLELLHQAKATMLVWHIGHKRPYKPDKLRSSLSRSLQLFPANSLILEAHAKVRGSLSAEFGVDMRDAIVDIATSRENLVSRHFSITRAICRFHAGTSTRDAVRNLFSAALEATGATSHLQSSYTLLKLWLDFEISLASDRVSADATKSLDAVKSVFYKGLRNLPWLKSWAIDGLSLISSHNRINQEDMRKVLDVVEERGLRLRSPLS